MKQGENKEKVSLLNTIMATMIIMIAVVIISSGAAHIITLMNAWAAKNTIIIIILDLVSASLILGAPDEDQRAEDKKFGGGILIWIYLFLVSAKTPWNIPILAIIAGIRLYQAQLEKANTSPQPKKYEDEE